MTVLVLPAGPLSFCGVPITAPKVPRSTLTVPAPARRISSPLMPVISPPVGLMKVTSM
ncbi:MAG: hypothetical protein ACYS0D_07375 [Planctomycetota bacterium]